MTSPTYFMPPGYPNKLEQDRRQQMVSRIEQLQRDMQRCEAMCTSIQQSVGAQQLDLEQAEKSEAETQQIRRVLATSERIGPNQDPRLMDARKTTAAILAKRMS